MGRKTTFSQAVADAILARLENGEPLEVICRSEGMPTSRTVRDWKEANPQFASDLAQARADGFDKIASDCIQIADDKSEDVVETPSGPKFNAEFAQRSKIRIETRLKLLAVWARSKYGEHATIQVEDSRPGLSRAEALAALQNGTIDVGGLLSRWTKPAEAIEAEAEAKTEEMPQTAQDQQYIDIPI